MNYEPIILIIIFTLIFLTLMIFSGCSPKTPVYQTVIKDSIVYKDTTLYRDVFVPIKGDTVMLRDTIPVPSSYELTKTRTAGHTTAKVSIKDKVLDVECNTQAYEDTIKNLKFQLQNKEQYKYKETTVEKRVEVPKTPNWVKWLIGLEVASAIVYAFFRGWLSGPLTFLGALFKKK